ncbi:hypothetical protein ABRP83_13685 [Pectobacterium brasiliense]|uniref:hypothetical protein n=1 Tax=Pectobacterium brasiliense TaxID=180957 RepID=UPI0032EDA183
MKNTPDRGKLKKPLITTARFDHETSQKIDEILSENPLYTRSLIMRASVLALHNLAKAERAELILEAAAH